MSYSLTVTESGGLTLGLTGPAGPAGPAGPVATPLVRSTSPISSSPAVAASAIMVLAGPIVGDTFNINGTVFEFVVSGGFNPAIVYIGLDELAPEESWPTIITAVNANVAAVSATFRSEDGELDIVSDVVGTSGNSITVGTTGGVSFIDSSAEVVTTLVGGAAAVTGTAASSLGQIAIVSETDVYACTRLSPVKWTLLSNPVIL